MAAILDYGVAQVNAWSQSSEQKLTKCWGMYRKDSLSALRMLNLRLTLHAKICVCWALVSSMLV